MESRVIRSRWTKEEDDFLRQWAGSITFQEIAKRLGRDRSAADARARRLGLRGMEKGIARKMVARRASGRPHGWCARRASLMHLIDLKRAGHSPRHTELTIPDVGALAMPVRQSIAFSGPGSPAAMCAVD